MSIFRQNCNFRPSAYPIANSVSESYDYYDPDIFSKVSCSKGHRIGEERDQAEWLNHIQAAALANIDNGDVLIQVYESLQHFRSAPDKFQQQAIAVGSEIVGNAVAVPSMSDYQEVRFRQGLLAAGAAITIVMEERKYGTYFYHDGLPARLGSGVVVQTLSGRVERYAEQIGVTTFSDPDFMKSTFLDT